MRLASTWFEPDLEPPCEKPIPDWILFDSDGNERSEEDIECLLEWGIHGLDFDD